MSDKKTFRVSTRIDLESEQAIRTIKQESGLSRSAIVRLALKPGLVTISNSLSNTSASGRRKAS
jgi:hypothetical protein